MKGSTAKPKCIVSMHHSVHKSPVGSSGFVELHKADLLNIADGARGSTFCLFTGFLLKNSTYHWPHLLAFFPCICSGSGSPECCIIHSEELSIYCIVCTASLSSRKSIWVELSTCPLCGPRWITAPASVEDCLTPFTLYCTCWPTMVECSCWFLHISVCSIIPPKVRITAHLNMVIWSFEQQLNSRV